MKADTGFPPDTPKGETSFWKKFSRLPATRTGKWAAALAGLFVIMMVINNGVFMQMTGDPWWRQTLLPYYGISMMLIGLISGITALVAIVRKQERSWLLWLPLLAGLFVVFFFTGEFLFPH